MILVDPREGSGHYAPLLKARGLHVEVRELPYGDIAFTGTGPESRPVFWGVEVKAIGDLLRCIADGRFAGTQLIGMQDAYEMRYLLIEGSYRENAEGLLELPRGGGAWATVDWGRGRSGGWTHMEVEHWLTTMEIKAGMRRVRTYNSRETAAWVHRQFSWWTGKSFEEHGAHLAHDNSDLMSRVALVAPSRVEKFARVMDGLGPKRAAAVAKVFKTVNAMVNSHPDDWRDVEGVGRKTAEKVLEAFAMED